MKQHMEALELANKIRLERAQVKRDLRSGTVTITELIQNTPRALYQATLFEFLTSQHRWGRERARKVLLKVRVSEYTTFGSLTDRQKRLLIEMNIK